MGLKEIIERLEPKIIQYLTIEREVVEELYKELFAGTLDRNEWNDYYIKIVKQYGNPIMINMIEGYRVLQDCAVEALGEENIVKQLKKSMESEVSATTSSYTESEKKKKLKLENLHGCLYDITKMNDLFLCPVCGDPMQSLNPLQHRPDNYYFRCNICKMDYKTPRK